MSNVEILLLITLIIIIIVLIVSLIPYLTVIIKRLISKDKQNNYGLSSKIRLIYQLKEAIEYLSKTKTGAIITIENNDRVDNLRTDGIIIDANISSSLIISIFNKSSPLHDGALVIRNNKIIYAATYYKITKKSINNKYGARHRAAMGISEVCDATTIIVSEETGEVTIAKNSVFIPVKISNFQEKLIFYLRD
ncbi:MAG: DNA integrity scanning protein DisA nucleotide-binding domain protein [Metamycoplasmataceae bacterium]